MSYKPLPVDPFILGCYLVNSTNDVQLKKFIKDKGYEFPLQLDIDLDFSNGLPLDYLQSSID
jgi:hypothetical protein